ncbi:UNVERIFIED_CONTAM: hypothetical protein OHV15_12110 [Microbacterium sp. SLM126]
MEIAASQSPSPLWRPALVGVLTAFAWLLLSLVLGLGSGDARAEETDDDSLLGAVTSLVDSTATTVTQTVSTATKSVTKVVNKVADVAPAPAQQPVREVVTVVGSAVKTVTEPVSGIVSGGVVDSVARPVVDAVTEVPLVGDIVSGLGLADAVSDLGQTVDHTLGDLVGTVTDTGAGLGLPPAGVIPGLPASPDVASIPVGGHPLPALGVVLPAAIPSGATSGAASALSAFLAAYAPVSAAAAAVASSDARVPLTPAGSLCPPSTSSSGPGGAGSGAWALVALGPLVALRAWVRRAGPEDEHAPAAPAASTDVSPD